MNQIWVNKEIGSQTWRDWWKIWAEGVSNLSLGNRLVGFKVMGLMNINKFGNGPVFSIGKTQNNKVIK